MDNSDFRRWDELIPDALGVIFTRLSLQERVTVIPRVCKSWAKAVTGPYCWQEIDIVEWSKRCQPNQLDRLLEMLITRSCGSLRKLCVSCLQTERIFTVIAENACSLRTLRLLRSSVSDSIVEQIAGRLSVISVLDVSYCVKLSACSLEMIGKNCKLLEVLCRNMHPFATARKPLEDDEAHAIASTMPNLKHLEMAYNMMSSNGVLKILSNCPKLEFFDQRGCWSVEVDNIFLKEKFPKLKVLGPFVLDPYYDAYSDQYMGWDIVPGYVDDRGSIEEMWDDLGRADELLLRFSEGIEDE